jgi:hypothetical protein
MFCFYSYPHDSQGSDGLGHSVDAIIRRRG